MYLHTKAGAQADGFGFQKYQAKPKAVSGQAQGLAWPGCFWPGLAWLLASGRSRHITMQDMKHRWFPTVWFRFPGTGKRRVELLHRFGDNMDIDTMEVA